MTRLQLLKPLLRALHTRRYDVIVVGGGHAGTEAAAASCRVGARTLLVTHRTDTIGALSCNPSLGGVGKGHLVREIDALGGLMGRAGDWAGLHFSVLNRSKGPAVWGPRAQLDRQRYREFVQAELFSTPRLTVCEGAVQDLLVGEGGASGAERLAVHGLRLADGSELRARALVLTTGTFLSGSLFVGESSSPGGRVGEAASCGGLSRCLREGLGLRVGRLRTGTPPRIFTDSIDFSLCERHSPDAQPLPFSFLNARPACQPEEQLPCFRTHTSAGVERVVRESLQRNTHIQQDARGPRYCPSIEAKVLRFPGRRHPVWLEPEGVASQLTYPQGLSMTMEAEQQQRLLREIPCLRRARIHTAGYGVQYDFVCPTQLFPWLQVRHARGLFLAGQINGTTGYEEAAAQGLWAGVNAGRCALSLAPLSLSRSYSYMGVLVDDLVGRGVTEPYRMFTSRAEFRSFLRPDNADMRLTLRGFQEFGCVCPRRHGEAVRVRQLMLEALATLRSLSLSAARWTRLLKIRSISHTKSGVLSGEELLRYSDVTFEMLASAFPERLAAFQEFSHRLKVEALYGPHCEAQAAERERVRGEENLLLPAHLDYLTLPASLSQEAREALEEARPHTLGAAARLPGVTPAAIVHLLNYVRRGRSHS